MIRRTNTGTGRQTPPLRLDRRRIYLLPTRYGWLFLLLLAAMLLGATNYQNNMAFLLTFLLAGLALVSLLHCQRNLSGLTVATITAAPVFAGRPALYRIRLDPADQTRSAVRLTLDGVHARLQDLSPEAENTVEIPLPTTGRGLQRPERLVVSSRYPLGLFRAWAPLRPEAECLVYPRPLPSALPMGPGPEGEGNDTVARPGTEDFEGLAAYQPGDQPQHIHWKGIARGQGVFTKRFAAAAGGAGLFDWFAVPETDPERKIGMLCHAVLEAERRKADYGLRLPGTVIRPAVGVRHRHRCLEALARIPAAA